MVPWFHPGTMEPWNLFCVAWNLGSMVPWFHLKKIWWNHGTMEPQMCSLEPWFHGSMVPPNKIFDFWHWNFGWNHGTMEPKMCSLEPWFHGSMVPLSQKLGGTMEPWNHGTQMCIMSNGILIIYGKRIYSRFHGLFLATASIFISCVLSSTWSTTKFWV